MTISPGTLVGEAEGDVTSATQTVSAAGAVPAGSLVVVGTITNAGASGAGNGGPLVSVTDARGNTYSLSSQLLGSSQNDIRTCVGWSVLGTALQAGDLITATWTNSVFQGLSMVAVWYPGIVASPLDQSGTAQDDGFPQSQPVGQSLTTAEADELLISWIGTQNVRTFSAPTTGWTARGTLSPGSDYSYLFEERIVSALGTYNSAPTLSADDYWNANTLTFKARADGTPTFRSVSDAGDSGTEVSSLTIPKPSGTADGDMLLAVISVGNIATISTPPAGWTYVGTSDWFGGRNNHVYWKVASSEGVDYTWAWSGVSHNSGIILCYQSTGGLDVVAIGSDYHGNPNMESVSVTTTMDGSLIVACYMAESALLSLTPDTSPAAIERVELENYGGAGPRYFTYVQEYVKPTAGVQTLTSSGWSDVIIGRATFALKPSTADSAPILVQQSGLRW